MSNRSHLTKLGALALSLALFGGAAVAQPQPKHHSKLKGAVVGAAAGHALGHHAVAGAAAGALVQHHKNAKSKVKSH